MSEAKSFGLKRYSKEPKHKQYSEGSAFSNIADDGLLTGPSVKTADDSSLLSDDENKTLTTLEPAKKPSNRDGANVSVHAVDPLSRKADRADDSNNIISTVTVVKPAANPGQAKKTLGKTIITTHDLLKTLKEQTKPAKPPPMDLPSKEALLQKMRDRLSKHIEIKSASAATPATPPPPPKPEKPMDTSGAIEIPQDLILSNEIPPTPISAMETKETELEDHDLIAILEGNDVEIRENATEIEVCVGTSVATEGMEEMQIYIVDQDEMQKVKVEREKEIARRQIANLPSMPKKRRTKTPIIMSPEEQVSSTNAAQKDAVVEAIKSNAKAIISKLPPGITVKGQTTIRPVDGNKSATVKEVKEEKVPPEQPSTARAAKVVKEAKPPSLAAPVKVSSARIKAPPPTSRSTPTKSSELVDSVASDWDEPVKVSSARIKVSPPTKCSELVDSLVSDWDDEPVGVPHTADTVKVEKSGTPPVEDLKPIVTEPSSVEEPAPKVAAFVAPTVPATGGEPRRVIKKKIIWDPSEATVPFSVLVKSNRGNGTASQAAPPKVNQTLRKRADSVAVHMLDQVPSRAPPKRALTPEPVRMAPLRDRGSEALESTTLVENNNIADAKGKKRKRNEIERLLADEGAINMLYDVECEANQKDLLKNTAVDTSDEDEKLIAKTKIITDAVINQGKSPTEGSNQHQQGLRVRAKRASTPSGQPGPANVEPVSPKGEPGGAATPSAAGPPVAAGVTKKSIHGPTGGAPTGARKRKAASKDWDYVYNAQGGDDAMIIRRRSNSSYSSSCASPHRLSVDQSYESPPVTAVPATEKQSSSQERTDDGFLFAKPTKPATSATGAEEMKVDPSLLANMRGKLSKALKSIKNDTLGPASKSAPNSPPTASNSSTVAKAAQVKRKVAAKGAPVKLEGNSSGGDYVVSPSGELIKQENVLSKAIEKRLNEMKHVSWTCDGDHVELVLRTKGVVASGCDGAAALCDVFSMEAMSELIEVFTMLEKESRITAVLLMSGGEHFSRGLDVAYLVQPVHKRKLYSEDMGECLKSFLKSLISFSKPIVAAVHGDVLGMGVMILPAFDVVLAQTGSSFETPYGQLGYLAEGMKAFTSCRALKPKAVTDLLMLGKRITSTTALDYGLVTEVIPAERFHDRARALVRKVASQSPQALQSIKQNMHRELLAKLDFVLKLEQKKHTQQWISLECQQKFKQFVSKGGDPGKMS